MNIVGPQIQPFALHHICPACGQNTTPFFRLPQWLFGSTDRHMDQKLCRGGKEPTEDGSVATLMGPVPVLRQWACAGISEPHLHVTCRNCNCQVITHTRIPLEA